MTSLTREVAAVARLELAEVLRSRWMVFCGAVYALLAGAFVLVGLRESSLLGFSGMGRVLLSFCHALVLLLPLLALTATGQVVNRAREDGTLELLFSLPVRRGAFFVAVSGVRYTALVVPLVVLMLGMSLLGQLAFGQGVPWGFLLRAVAVCAALLLAFVGLGIAVSTLVRSQARAMIWLLTLWALGVALIDFGLVGLMLQWRLDPRTVFLLAALNPVQAARMALLSGVTPDLSVLGPVGFFLANRLGGAGLFAVGTLWPVAVGLGAWAHALRRFQRSDLV
ncbi:ABC transporter permease [Pyxidicoccus caerfyrddinensis]|uniref:ABC transporter permease n=1 Tax=Pyxidicoccus caerfyrddinensis TaxID=2709663 RepID=UPI0013DD17A3|nr:ABC transporter permease subunit [Pyxidicoccus caerfyrddinensis]